MKRLRWTGVMVVALFAMSLVGGVLLNPPQASAQSPVTVEIIGKVLTPSTKGEADIYTLDLKHEKLRFRVDQGITPDYAMESNTIYDVLGTLQTPSIRVLGKREVLKPLLQPGVEGKYFFMQGDLYTEPQLLVVTKVKEVGKRVDEGPDIKGGKPMEQPGL